MPTFPPFRLDLVEERLWKGTTEVAVRRKPFAILRYLVEHPRRLVTHDELLEHVWGGNTVSESAVRSHLHELRQVLGEGVIETVVGRGYRFVAALDDDDPGPAQPAAPLDRAFVGRAAELAALDAALERAQGGQRQICFVIGEPGIGKTSLLDAFFARLEARKVAAVRGHCLEQYGTPEAYFAVIEMLGRLRRTERGDQLVAALVRHAPSFLVQLPHLIPEAQVADVTRRAGSESRIARELIEAFESLAITQPLVLALEDVQWSDVATIDLISLLGQRRERTRLMVIVTSRRAEAQTVSQPLNRVMRNLVARSGAHAVTLPPIEPADVRQLVDLRFPGHAFPDGFLDIVARVTAGTPLFVASFLDDLVTSGLIATPGGRWSLTASLDEIAGFRPDSVRQLIDIQLDRLSLEEQRVLEAASLIGTQFATSPVAAALGIPAERAEEICDDLASRGLFLRAEAAEEWPDATVPSRFGVTHALVQEVCFDRAAPSRRQRWHQSIAAHLAAAYGPRAAEIAHVLATHFEHAQLPASAAEHYLVAGERTSLRFAIHDAARMFRRGHALVQRLPETAERDRLELRALGGIAQSVLFIDYPEHEPVELFERTIAVARRLGEEPQVYAAKVNLCFRYSTMAEYGRAAAIADELAAIEQAAPIAAPLRMFADCGRALCATWRGELDAASRLLEVVTASPGVNAGAMGILGATDRVGLFLIHLAGIRWLRGDPAGAFADTEQAIASAARSGDPYTLGAAHCILARLHFWSRHAAATIAEAAERTLAISEAEVWQPQATLLAAAARSQLAAPGDDEVEELTRVFRARSAAFPMGATVLALPLVEIYRRVGQVDRAAALVDEMLAFAEAHGEGIVDAEYLRLRGELLEAADPAAAADRYREALGVADRRGSHALALRAALRLAAVAVAAPERVAARGHLERCVAAFTAGADTPDLAQARALLVTS